MLYFVAIITLLVEKPKWYCQQYFSPVPNVSQSEMFQFLVVIIQMGHDIHDNINDYLPTTEQSSVPF
jgi:hypothetical protein